MQIELRSTKIVQRLSEETLCFTATMYLDGQPAGTVANRGNGGSHEYSDWDALSRLDAYASTLPRRLFPPEWALGDYAQTADSLIDDCLTDHQLRADLTKKLKSRVLFTTADGKVMQTGTLKGASLWVAVVHYQRNKPQGCVTVLNALPFDEALALYRTV